MPQTTAEQAKTRRPRNWRHSETRASPKHIAKRVTEDNHANLKTYADDHQTTIGELLDPYVSELIKKANKYCAEKARDERAEKAANASESAA
ncbi:MAG: hypothetical protein K0U84_08650 [Actinomycetia bacterium]|nr:hypothetical protein [Actinomycetes bacterium]